MLYIVTGEMEQCEAHKKPIHTICPHIWIHYVLDGAGYYEGELLERGKGFIVYPGDACAYRPDTENPWRYFWIRILGEDTENLLEKCDFPRRSGVFSFSYADELEAIFSSAFYGDSSRYDSKSLDNPLFSEAVCKLILSLNREKGEQSEHAGSRKWVNLAIDYMQANYHKQIRVEELAAMLHLDRKYLRNLFVRYTGISTREYLTRMRIERAKELLDQTDADISVIAASVGYEDALEFSKLFKKHVALSPKGYRERGKSSAC